MSALNVFLTPDAAHVFSDAAIYDAKTFGVAGFASKVLPIPQYNAVIGATGYHWIALLLAGALAESTFDDFDHLADEFAPVIRRYVEKTRHIPGADPLNTWGNFTAGLAGWSPSANAPAFLSIRGFNCSEAPAFEPLRSTRFINPAAAHAYDFSILNMTFDPATPAESGLAIMRAQRSKRFTSLEGNDNRTVFGIGGFCQHTIITRDAITTRVLERWPDKIGEKVQSCQAPSTAMGTFGQL